MQREDGVAFAKVWCGTVLFYGDLDYVHQFETQMHIMYLVHLVTILLHLVRHGAEQIGDLLSISAAFH